MKTITDPITGHEKRSIKIDNENVYIDVKAVTLVRWINTLPNCRTTFCCGGEHKSVKLKPNTAFYMPYIAFTANKKMANNIKQILKAFSLSHPKEEFAFECDTRVQNGKKHDRYAIRFDNQEIMVKFGRYCKSCDVTQ